MFRIQIERLHSGQQNPFRLNEIRLYQQRRELSMIVIVYIIIRLKSINSKKVQHFCSI